LSDASVAGLFDVAGERERPAGAQHPAVGSRTGGHEVAQRPLGADASYLDRCDHLIAEVRGFVEEQLLLEVVCPEKRARNRCPIGRSVCRPASAAYVSKSLRENVRETEARSPSLTVPRDA